MRKGLLAILAGVLVVVVIAGCTIALLRYVFPGPTRVFVSDSPDGKHRLEVWEQVPWPRPLKESPYTYRCELLEMPGGRRLVGASGVLDNDSAMLGPGGEVFRATWSKDHVVFMDRMDCDFSTGSQVWTRR